MDDPQARPLLFHPELRNKSRAWLVLRSSFLSRWWYPPSEMVSWYGGLIREGGGNGMFATADQALAWAAAGRVVKQGNIVAGPG